MTLSLFFSLGRGHFRPKELCVATLGGCVLVPGHLHTHTKLWHQARGWVGGGGRGPCFPQTQLHAISLYSRHVLTQARGQINDKQMNLNWPRVHGTWNHRTPWPWVETLSGVHTSASHYFGALLMTSVNQVSTCLPPRPFVLCSLNGPLLIGVSPMEWGRPHKMGLSLLMGFLYQLWSPPLTGISCVD